jgi:hypothetical protein
MTEPAAPCRLFVYLARDAPVGAVLRRGPSDWVRLSRWDLERDLVEHGQWMHARVYERRSDLSPDGSLFVAFVRGTPDEPAPHCDTWIAISRPPWFTALALWFVGGTYCAGGFFPEPHALWTGFELDAPDLGTLPAWLRAADRTLVQADGTPDWTDRTVWHNRLRRDGWRRIADAKPETWSRPHPSLPLTLAMTIRSTLEFHAFGGRYLIDYAVHDREGIEIARFPAPTWADWDRRGRLAVARDGRLLLWERETGERLLADFNDQTPDPQPAPKSALAWPPSPAIRSFD